MDKVFIGLGSNLNEPLAQLKKALAALKKMHDSHFIKVSHFYRSLPMGPQDQPDYINAVAELKTKLSAEQLLDALQTIENEQGRVRQQRWGARTLDLDILLYGNEVINTERLTVPHYGMKERNFVLYPLSELINGDFNIPSMGTMKELLASCSIDGLQRLDA